MTRSKVYVFLEENAIFLPLQRVYVYACRGRATLVQCTTPHLAFLHRHHSSIDESQSAAKMTSTCSSVSASITALSHPLPISASHRAQPDASGLAPRSLACASLVIL